MTVVVRLVALQLDVHIHTVLNLGLTSKEIIEVSLQAAAYCSFLRALNAVFTGKKIFAVRGLLPVAP